MAKVFLVKDDNFINKEVKVSRPFTLVTFIWVSGVARRAYCMINAKYQVKGVCDN